jgi:hypothetical protein
MYAMIMMVILVVIEKHIIFTVRKWPEQHTMVKRFAYPKDLLLLRDQLMLERNATPPHGQEIIHMGNIYG